MENIDIDVETEQLDTDVVEESEVDLKNTSKESPNQKQKFLRLPLARVKTMMKKDPDCGLLSQDSVFLVTKATEMFIEFMTKEAGKQTMSSKRKTVMRRDVDATIQSVPQLCFLDGALES